MALMSRVIGDSRGSCPRRGSPSSMSLVVSSASPPRPRPMGCPASICTGCSSATGRAAWRPSTPGHDARPATPARSATRSSSPSCGCANSLTGRRTRRRPVTLQWHLPQAGLPVPSTSTIRRILHHHGLITPQPRKRPAAPITDLKPPNPTNAGNPTSPTGTWPTAPTPRSSTGSTTTPDTCWPAPPTAESAGPDVVGQLHRHRQHLRPASIHLDRQRLGLHRTIHPRPQRIRTPAPQPRHHPEKRPPRPPPNPRQNRTLPPNPQTLADPTTTAHHLTDLQALLDTFRAHLQHRNAPTAPYRPHHTRTGLHRPTQSRTTATTTPRHFRIRRDTVDDCGKLTLRYANRLHHLGIGIAYAGTKVLILVTAHHRHRPSHTRYQLIASHHHRPRPQLLAQPTKTPRPMAGAICNR